MLFVRVGFFCSSLHILPGTPSLLNKFLTFAYVKTTHVHKAACCEEHTGSRIHPSGLMQDTFAALKVLARHLSPSALCPLPWDPWQPRTCVLSLVLPFLERHGVGTLQLRVFSDWPLSICI